MSENATAPAASEGAAGSTNTTSAPAGLSASLLADNNASNTANTAAQQPATAETQKAWYDEAIKDPQLKEWVGKKGWKDVEGLAKSALNLEKMKGVDETKLLRIPDAADETGKQEFYNRLGRPEKPEDYVDKEMYSKIDKTFLEAAHKEGLTKQQVASLLKYDQQRVAAAKEAQEQAFATKAASDIADMQREWGGRFDEMKEMARRGAQALGVDAEGLGAIERAMGTKGMMNMLHKLAQRTSEARFVEGDAGSSNRSFGMSPQQAADEIKSLGSQKGHFERLVSDAAYKQNWDNLFRIKNGIK